MEVREEGGEVAKSGSKKAMTTEVSQIIIGAAGMTPHTLTAGGATAAATATIGPGPTS
jgi:hypothetical protein